MANSETTTAATGSILPGLDDARAKEPLGIDRRDRLPVERRPRCGVGTCPDGDLVVAGGVFGPDNECGWGAAGGGSRFLAVHAALRTAISDDDRGWLLVGNAEGTGFTDPAL